MTEIDNDIVIDWGDKLIFASNHKGEIPLTSLRPLMVNRAFDTSVKEMDAFHKSDLAPIHNKVVDALDFNEQSAILEIYRVNIYDHLLNSGYIEERKPAQDFWLLNERGKLVKELKGHINYLKYRDRELNPEKHQLRHDLKLAIITGAITLLTGYILWLIDNHTKNQEIQKLKERLEVVEKKK